MVVIIGRNDEVRQLSVSAAVRLAEIAATSRAAAFGLVRERAGVMAGVRHLVDVATDTLREYPACNSPSVLRPGCSCHPRIARPPKSY